MKSEKWKKLLKSDLGKILGVTIGWSITSAVAWFVTGEFRFASVIAAGLGAVSAFLISKIGRI